MATEKQVREALIGAFQQLQKQNSLLLDLTIEVASIRNALIEIGPQYGDVLTRHRAKMARETKPVADRFSQI